MLNGAIYIRRELLIRLVRAFDDGTLREELDHIPVKLRPKDMQSSRCCIYHDRAVLKYRLMALLGVCPEDEEDEAKTLASYFDDMVERIGATLDGNREVCRSIHLRCRCAPDFFPTRSGRYILRVVAAACRSTPAASVLP